MTRAPPDPRERLERLADFRRRFWEARERSYSTGDPWPDRLVGDTLVYEIPVGRP